MNAKDELIEKLKEIGDIPIKCGHVYYVNEENQNCIISLQCDYTERELLKFFLELDFEYDNNDNEYIEPYNYELDGTIWLIDNTWINRTNHTIVGDVWVHIIGPKIPEELIKKKK